MIYVVSWRIATIADPRIRWCDDVCMAKAPLDPETGRRRRGRPPALNVDMIAAAALAELEHLSVAAVARRLGVAQGGIYHHVAGRSDLVRLAADEALRDWPGPDRGLPWRDLLHAYAYALWQCLWQHPGLEDAIQALTEPPPRLAAVVSDVVELLMAEGVEQQTARDAVLLVTHLAHDEARWARMSDPQEPNTDRLLRRVDLVLDGVQLRIERPGSHDSK